MVERKRRKKNKLRGKRTHGGGNVKNRRGAGCRGGRGNAGSRTHNYVKHLLAGNLEKKKKLKSRKSENAINLDTLEEKMSYFLEKGLVEKKGEDYLIDGKKFPYEKILSRGTVNRVFVLQNIQVSQKAGEKIINAGGIVEEAEGEEPASEEEVEVDIKEVEKE